MSYLKLSFAKKKFVINKLALLLTSCAVLFTCIFGAWWGFSYVLDNRYKLFLTPVGMAILIFEIWIANKISIWSVKKIDAKMDVYDHDAKIAEKGAIGEDLVHKELLTLLNSQDYQIYQNLILPNLKSDLDFVLVGPKGVILLEVKNYQDSKVIYMSKESFYKSKNNELIKILPDLREIVNWRAGRLERYLAENGVDRINVRKVILYVNPESVEIKEYGDNYNRVFIIQGLKKLQNYLDSSKDDVRFTSDRYTKVNIILAKLDE